MEKTELEKTMIKDFLSACKKAGISPKEMIERVKKELDRAGADKPTATRVMGEYKEKLHLELNKQARNN